jgi:DNA sulfur modification protein DndC
VVGGQGLHHARHGHAWAIEPGCRAAEDAEADPLGHPKQEFAPLNHAAEQLGAGVRRTGLGVVTVEPEQDKGLWVNVLGRGVVPPNSMTARWCTRQLKQDPMAALLRACRRGERPLMLTGCGPARARPATGRWRWPAPARRGVRAGAVLLRHARRAGRPRRPDRPLEDVQGVGVAEELRPEPPYGEWPTELIADAYGGQGESEEEAARRASGPGASGARWCRRGLGPRGGDRPAAVGVPRPAPRAVGVWAETAEPRHRLRKRGYEVGDPTAARR